MTGFNLEDLTIAGTADQIKRKKISPVELTRFYLERIQRLNPIINAYITVTQDTALRQARRAEKEILRGQYRGPLHGVPFSIKDNLTTRGVRTTAGSKVLAEWKPDFDATVVARLREAGAVILGKANMHEWALGGTTINPFFGTAHNPWDYRRICGGSSGGSGAAVASAMCMASIGTDSAQSVRNPASMCGVVGLKPTYGRVSRFGAVPGTGGYSTDHVGILSRTVEDCSLVLQAVAGHDPKDPLSSEEPVPRYSAGLGRKVKNLKVGVLRGYFDELVGSEVKMAFSRGLEVLRSLGVKTEEVSIPHLDLVPAVKRATSRPENVSAHDRNLRTRARDYSPQVLYNYVSALLIPAGTYVTAQRVRRVICEEFENVMRRVQVLALPTVPFPAPTIEECERGFIEIDGRQVSRDSRGGLDSVCTAPFNLTGLPALSLCCGFSRSGMPIGMQIVGRAFEESTVFRVAHAYERAAGWTKRRPELSERGSV